MSSSKVISHSEVETYLLCEQRHFYAFGDNTFGPLVGLEPNKVSDALYRGIVGHDALGAFYQYIKDGCDYEDAKKMSAQALMIWSTKPNPHYDILADLNSRLLPRYFEYARRKFDEGWRPEYVEHEFQLKFKVDDVEYIYPFKPDVIMRDPAGNLWVWDHKFVYNFYTQDEINLLPQIPKYIGALRALGLHIKGGYYNQIRHREVKDLDKHNRLDPFVPTDARVVNAFKQQIRVMERIAGLKSGLISDWEDSNNRTLNGMVCKTCSFKYLCATQLNGSDGKLMRQVEFSPNSYGYKEQIADA
jgi:hypothetical protein